MSFHFFLSSNIFLYAAFYPKRGSFLCIALMSFSVKILLKYFVCQYHYMKVYNVVFTVLRQWKRFCCLLAMCYKSSVYISQKTKCISTMKLVWLVGVQEHCCRLLCVRFCNILVLTLRIFSAIPKRIRRPLLFVCPRLPTCI